MSWSHREPPFPWSLLITAALAVAPGVAAGGPATGDLADDTDIVQTLVEEMQRNLDELSLAGAPPMYHLRFHLERYDHASAVATFGALSTVHHSPTNQLGIEVRVGEPSFDNTGFGGWETGRSSTSLPDELTARSLRQATWRLTDGAYKDAVEQLARKSAAYTPPPDHPGDFELTGPTVADGGGAGPCDGELVAQLAREISAAFPADLRLERAEVHAACGSGEYRVLDSEGTDVRIPMVESSIRAIAHVRADDGSLLSDHRTWIVRNTSQLPDPAAAGGEIEEMAARLAALATAPVLEEEYVGPVIFEDDAAADLFRYLLVPQLEGTPPVIPFNSFFGEIGQGFVNAADDGVRLGRRVLPPGWEVVDDPTADPTAAAGFTHDSEGTPAQRVGLVTDGIVRTVLMSRVPRKGVEETNGHARFSANHRLEGRATVLTVVAPKHLPAPRLHREALKLARAYGRDHVIVVRRLQDDSVRKVGTSGGFRFRFGGDGGEDSLDLPLPLEVVRLFADGREEPVRGAAFAGVHRYVLRDIVAAGPPVEIDYMAPFDRGQPGSGPLVGLPTSITAPAVLVGELELVPRSGDPHDCTVVPQPTAGP